MVVVNWILQNSILVQNFNKFSIFIIRTEKLHTFLILLKMCFKQIWVIQISNVVIKTASEYVDFFINLNMGKDVPLLNFVNNEKMVLKQKLGYKNLEKDSIKKGIMILEELVREINETNEKSVLEKYQK
jgi:hypothetical protein